jgi:hypothetical protein
VDDFFVSAANVDFSATDAAAVFIGATKLGSNAVIQRIFDAETASTSGRAAILCSAAVSGGVFTAVRGSAESTLTSSAGVFNQNTSAVITLLGKISTDTHVQRVNAVETASSAGDLGTGSFGNIARYIGALGGTAGFFSGNIYQLIAVGKTPTTPELSATENFVAQKTKGSLA